MNDWNKMVNNLVTYIECMYYRRSMKLLGYFYENINFW